MLNSKDILERLRTLREEMDLRQDYMAMRLGVDRSTYVRKERGSIPITTDEWLKLAEAMDRQPAYFFSFTPVCIQESDLGEKERLLVKLYRSLRADERSNLICNIHLTLKCIRRKAIRDTLEMLKSP